MQFIKILSVLFLLNASVAMAGLVSLDVDDLVYVDEDTGSTQLGGRLQFLFDESVADSNASTDIGRYHNAIKGGQFWNFRNGKNYYIDLAEQNHVQVEMVSDMYTGITLRGYFKDDEGNSRLFDLWMEANFKADDYLHTLKSHVNVWENSVIFNLFEPQDHFEGFSPVRVAFNAVPESAALLLFISGLLGLGLRRNSASR